MFVVLHPGRAIILALAEAVRIDDVKDIRDKALAMQTYALQAKDTVLIGYATEIRLRAERRCGELLTEMADRGERQKPGDNPQGRNSSAVLPLAPTLSDLGVSKTQSSRWRALARLPEEKMEAKVERAKGKAEQATTSAPRHSKSEFTGEQDWHTPVEYVDLALEVLGSIDLDPASSSAAQEKVKASRFFDISINGLAQEWKGRDGAECSSSCIPAAPSS